ncbi:MAG: hypothetical protein PVI26_00065 [Chitinispirillia bacterium]|jgi:hypothetical protein
MESFEVMKKTINILGAKAVASHMNLSMSLIYKWCQLKELPDSSGADNPLDRVIKICKLTNDISPIEWLCQKADGVFVPNPKEKSSSDPYPIKATQGILSEFSGLLDVVSKSIEDDQAIDLKEAEKIREVWEKFKSITESFVRTCESGNYEKK